MKKLFFVLALIFVFISACAPKEDGDAAKAKKLIKYHKNKFDDLPLSGKVIDNIRVIEVKGSQYDWQPENIVVKKGDKIKLVVESLDVPHGFEIEGIVIPGWNPDNLIRKGGKAVLEFTAEEAGVWGVVCTGYCGPGHAGMRRKYIVRG